MPENRVNKLTWKFIRCFSLRKNYARLRKETESNLRVSVRSKLIRVTINESNISNATTRCRTIIINHPRVLQTVVNARPLHADNTTTRMILLLLMIMMMLLPWWRAHRITSRRRWLSQYLPVVLTTRVTLSMTTQLSSLHVERQSEPNDLGCSWMTCLLCMCAED